MARRLYVLLLFLLPRTIRRRHADGMCALFDERLAQAHATGWAAVVRRVVREYLDVVRAAINERRGRDPLRPPAPTPDRRRRLPLAGLTIDLRFAWRLLRSHPSFTATAVATLALGIGANAAVFSVVHGVLLRPLGFDAPDRVVVLFHGTTEASRGTHSPVSLRDYEARNRSFSDLATYHRQEIVVTGHGDPARLMGYRVTANFFNVIPNPPIVGRPLQQVDEEARAAVILIDETLSRQRFGEPAAALGERLALGGVPYEIVGVLATRSAFPEGARFWIPLHFDPDDLTPNQRGAHYLQAIARLRPDTSIEAAQSDIDRIAAELAVEYPSYHEGTMMPVVAAREALTEDVSGVLWLLFGAVGLLLLVACANVANLLLSRATARQGEVALRASLGASGIRLLRQFVVESLVLALAGAGAGLLLAALVIRPLLALAPAQLPRVEQIGLNWPVVLFTIGVAVTCALVFGVTPLRTRDRADLTAGVKVAGDRQVAGSGRRRLRHALAVAEVALALVLVTGTLLMTRSIGNLSRVEPGFDPSSVLTFALTLPEATYDTSERMLGRFRSILEAFERTPGVRDAGLALGAPFSQTNPFTTFSIDGDTAVREDEPTTDLRVVWGRYFRTLRIPVLRGRSFDVTDTPTSQLVAVVNETFAERFFPGENPVGRQIRPHARLSSLAPSGYRTIVGVVGNVRQRSLVRDATPEVFVPYTQHALEDGLVLVRTDGPPEDTAAALRVRLQALDSNLPMADVRTMEQLVDVTTAQHRFTRTLLGVFAAVAVLLAAIGLYGTLSFGVAQRTREIGLRMALGAERGSVLSLFLAQGVRIALVGATVGLLGALALGQQLDALLVGISHADPVTLGAAVAGVCLVVVAASFVPARRATRLDPTEALRHS